MVEMAAVAVDAPAGCRGGLKLLYLSSRQLRLDQEILAQVTFTGDLGTTEPGLYHGTFLSKLPTHSL
jgi:hypothetical protein